MRKLLTTLFCAVFVAFIIPQAKTQPVSLNDETLLFVYLNLEDAYDLYSKELDALSSSENEETLTEIETQLANHLRGHEISIASYIEDCKAFRKKDLFKPAGPLWFSLSSSYRPDMVLKAQIKPQEFYQSLYEFLGKPYEMKQAQQSAGLVKLELPTSLFALQTEIKPDGISLFTKDKPQAKKTDKIWQESLAAAKQKKTILEAQLNFTQVKRLLAFRYQNNQLSNCLGNLGRLKNAIEIYQLGNGTQLDKLDFELLKDEHYLAAAPVCQQGGKYELLVENGSFAPACSMHGTIKNPRTSQKNLDVEADPRLKPFKALRINLKTDSLQVRLQITDKATLEQWHAIVNQQLLTVAHMARNQMGQLSEAQKQKAADLIKSIKCSIDQDWLLVKTEGFSTPALGAALIGTLAGLEAMALPRFIKARKNDAARDCLVKRRMLNTAIEMFNSENRPAMEKLDLNLLFKREYLSDIPECKAGGKYRLNDNGKVDCSVHGL